MTLQKIKKITTNVQKTKKQHVEVIIIITQKLIKRTSFIKNILYNFYNLIF